MHVMPHDFRTNAQIIVNTNVKGKIFECKEGLSFWGGVDPNTKKKEKPDSADIPNAILLPKKKKQRKENIPF